MKNSQFIICFAVGVTVLIFSCRKDQVLKACALKETIHFSTQIKPMIDKYCISCHGAGGTSPDLSTYANISSNATKILNSLNGTGVLMPQGGPPLNDSLITQFSCWMSQGRQNN